LVTTRSPGFIYHGWPYDFWRYEPEDMKHIFRDFHIEQLERDPQQGVLVKCIKPQDFHEIEPGNYPLFSIVTRRKTIQLDNNDLKSWRFKQMIFTQRLKEFLIKRINAISP